VLAYGQWGKTCWKLGRRLSKSEIEEGDQPLRGSSGGKPDTLKGVCPVWEGLDRDRSVEAEYGAIILPHIVPPVPLAAPLMRGVRRLRCKAKLGEVNIER